MDDRAHLRVREMTPADCRPVAGIRIAGWRTAYAGLMPQPYLDALDVEADTERRRHHLAHAGPEVVNLVAERDGEVVGWACHGPYRDEDGNGEAHAGDAELYAVYVHPERSSRGVGRALLTESLRRCADTGYGRMLLWVLRENTPARGFYERFGFSADGAEEPFEVAGAAVPEVRYARAL